MSPRFSARFLCTTLVLSALPVLAADNKGQLPERTDAEILKTVTLPPDFEATVFAKPPEGGYPTSVSAAVDGTIFVAIDENGSLGRDRNEPGKARGKVIRMRDTKGTGHADEFKTFCEVESPRGVIWDGPSGNGPGVLYVMHPPNLTAYYDDDGDGKADRQEDILTGLGFDLSFRGADHTTNGCRLAIDGYIYIAMGDYGCVEAKGKDGRTLKHRGGGIVRIRPDGTGLELVVEGTRNIYDVSVSPRLDIFTRDNTNDGGGWNDRLSYHPPGAHMGYPIYFKNFPEDMIETLADYGDGSPVGSLWLDEPGMKNGFYTVEWGRNGIDYHPLKEKGAGFELVGPDKGKENWMKLTRPTDMDVDASGHIYVTSWEGATFNYNGPYAGYVLQLTKKDHPKVEVPDFKKGGDDVVLGALFSDSAVLRLAAQREFLRRATDLPKASSIGMMLGMAMSPSSKTPLEGRIAALFTAVGMKHQLRTSGSPAPLTLLQDEQMTQYVLAALGDPACSEDVPTSAITPYLTNADPRVRIAAITALRRLHKTDAAQAMLPLVADSDPIIDHVAFHALRMLEGADVCLGALDSADDKVKPGALKALYGIYEPKVVDGLIQRLSGAQGEYRRGLLNALCRLANQEAVYEDPKVWWSTRPDTSGPIYQAVPWSETDKISGALKKALDGSNEEDTKWLIARMYACRVNFPGLVELMLVKAGSDTPAKLTAIEGMIRNDNSMPPEAIKALQSVTSDEKQSPELRVRALRLFQRCMENGSVFPGAVEAFAPLAGHDLGDPKLTTAFEDFTRDGKNGKWVGSYSNDLHGSDPAKRQLAATVLVNLSTGRVGRENERDAAKKTVEKSMDRPETAAALLTAIARSVAKPYAELVKASLNNSNNAVAEAALFAYQKLGLKESGAPVQTIGNMKYEEIFAAVQKGGDAKAGQEMYLRAGCIACHTLSPDEPPKGPILSAVAKMYDRAALTESILKPSAKIAQGFESQWFKTKKGEQIMGFVTREGGDSVDVRNIAGQTTTLEKSDIAERGTDPKSIMPEGLLNSFTTTDLSNLLAWLESLKK